MAQSAQLTRFNGHSMVGPLERVLVCSPRAAGWNLPERATRWQNSVFITYQIFPKLIYNTKLFVVNRSRWR